MFYYFLSINVLSYTKNKSPIFFYVLTSKQYVKHSWSYQHRTCQNTCCVVRNSRRNAACWAADCRLAGVRRWANAFAASEICFKFAAWRPIVKCMWSSAKLQLLFSYTCTKIVYSLTDGEEKYVTFELANINLSVRMWIPMQHLIHAQTETLILYW